MLRFNCLALTLALPLAAQAPAPTNLTRGLLQPLQTHADQPGYGIWAAGADYKVGFEGGFEFVPYAGPRYAENQSLRWRTTSVRIGEEELVTQAPHGREVDGLRYEYDLGGVVEAYDISSAGVEQTFVIARAPATRGELVVTGVVATPLRIANRATGHGAVALVDTNGVQLIDYGAVTAVDANGAEVPMLTESDGDQIRLRLAAETVRSVAFPLLIDPLILSTSTQHSVGKTAVCKRWGSWRCAMYTRIASAMDHDVYVCRSNAGDWSSSTPIHANVSSRSHTTQIACSGTNTGAMFAYVREYGPTSDLYTLHSNSGALTISPASGARIDNPSMSGANNHDKSLLIYEETIAGTAQVKGTVMWSGGNQTPLPGPIATGAPGMFPSVCEKLTSSGDQWMVAWAETGASTSRVRARLVDVDGTLGPSATLVTSSTRVYRDIEVDGDRDQWAATYYANPRGVGFNSLRCVRFDTNGVPFNVLSDRSIVGGLTYENGGLAFDRRTASTWLAAYTVFNGLSSHNEFARIALPGAVLTTTTPQTVDRPRAPSVAFDSHGSPPRLGQFIAVYATQGSQNRVMGEDLPYPAEVYSPFIVPNSVDCGGIDELATVWQPSNAGNQAFELSLQFASPLAALMVGSTPLSVPLDLIGMTGCALNVDAFVTLPATPHVQSAHPQVSWPLPAHTGMLGVDAVVQWFWADPGANALGVESSSAFVIQIR